MRRPFYARHAEAYDQLITDPVEPWVDAVHERLVREGLAPARLLDAGCGTGRHAAAFAARGHRVDLADAAPELLAQAAARCPGARTFPGDLAQTVPAAAFDAVTCRGVLNDVITDADRAAVAGALARGLRTSGILFLDVREADGARARADGAPRTSTAGELTFTARTTWDDGLLRVEEQYQTPDETLTYAFTMRPWTRPELHAVLAAAGLHDLRITPGVGRRTPDRLYVTATAPPAPLAAEHRH